MPKKKTKEEFIKESQEKHKDENGNPLYGYDEVEYVNSKTPVLIYCKVCNEYFPQTPNKHLIGHGCPNCANRNKLFTREEFIKRAESIHKDENGNPLYGYDRVEYINSKSYIWIYCKKCKEYFRQRANNHLRGFGCSTCSGRKKLTKEEFIQKAKILHGNKYDYKDVNYINNDTQVIIHCNDCDKDFLQTPLIHLQNHGCPFCNESKGEKKIRVWLENNNFIKDEDYISQYRCDWLENLILDFYFPKFKLGIEYDGEQHFKPVEIWGGEEKFKKIQERDFRKNILCEENGIKLLRIPYTEFDSIEEILDKKLKKS